MRSSLLVIGAPLAVLLFAFLSAQPESSSAAIVGDANCTGNIDAKDALVVLLEEAEIEDVACSGDTDCDGDSDLADVLAILRHIGGIGGGAGIASACPPIGSTFEPTPTSPPTTPLGSATHTPGDSSTPTGTATASESTTTVVTPTPISSGSVTPTPTVTPTATPTPSPTPTSAPPCDSGLAIDDPDAADAAKALGICVGLQTAAWVLPDGAAPPTTAAFHLGHGILDGFGAAVTPRAGDRLLGLSSGRARDQGDPDPCGSLTCNKGYSNAQPPGFPDPPDFCPEAAAANDGIALRVTVQAPANVTGFSFDWKWYAFESGQWECTNFSDGTAVSVDDVNVMLDASNNAVNSFTSIEVCSGTPDCPNTATDFIGTGFGVWDDAGATLWHTETVPVTPGNTYTVVFSIWDTGDGAWDSTTLFDNFRWLSSIPTPTITPIPTPSPTPEQTFAPDEYETNNTAATAKDLGTINGDGGSLTVSGNFHASADTSDFFKVFLDYDPFAQNWLEVTLSLIPTGSNYDLYVYSSDNPVTPAYIWSQNPGSQNEFVQDPLAGEGYYWIEVRRVSGPTTSQNYQLAIEY